MGENCPFSTTLSTQLHCKTDRHIARLNASARISAEFESQGVSKKNFDRGARVVFWGGGGGELLPNCYFLGCSTFSKSVLHIKTRLVVTVELGRKWMLNSDSASNFMPEYKFLGY